MSDEVCIANIGPDQRTLRMRMGIASLSAGVMVAIGGAAFGFAPWSHAVASVWFYGGFLGVFQAREHT